MSPIVSRLLTYSSRGQIRNLVSFFVPRKVISNKIQDIFSEKKVVTIIPSYKPLNLTVKLVENIYKWHKNVEIVFVNDCSPDKGAHIKYLKAIKKLARSRKRVHFIKTPKNYLKAGALNYGSSYIKNKLSKPDVIITFDDDVTILKNTIPTLVNTLYSVDNFGAVCSKVRIRNKNKNLVTRLQGLEYHGFNISRIADNGFFMGPLVMQGMLVAFRAKAFYQAGGFSENNLIEDYEITAKIKANGWEVGVAPDCWAWTKVPEKLSVVWKQRVRWTYGGMTVIENYYKSIIPVLQDLIGHLLFIVLFTLIVLSFVFTPAEVIPKYLLGAILMIAFLQFATSYLFNIYVLRFYRDADWKDHALRLTILPELFYSNFLTLVLLGAYPFYLFNKIFAKSENKLLYNQGMKLFNKLGYSLSWGTR